MIAEARRRYPKPEFRQGDAESLGFPDDSFDAVICAFGILHLGEPERAIAEAFRVLKPEGRYAFSVWCTPEKAELLGMALKIITGLADMNVPLPPAPLTYRGNTADDVWDWFEKSTVRTMALVRLQTAEIQAQIKDGIVRAAALYRSSDGITIPCPALLYNARKPSA